MIEKYTIDLEQFNNGESGKITFPSFAQCLMFGIYKLKRSIEEQPALIQAVLIEDVHGRKIIITPSHAELQGLESMIMPSLKVKLEKDPVDGEGTFHF